jgi:hypothetical protein
VLSRIKAPELLSYKIKREGFNSKIKNLKQYCWETNRRISVDVKKKLLIGRGRER